MATNKELTEQVKLLKEEVRTLRSEAKTVEADISGLNDDAYALNKVGSDYQLIKIVYDLEKNQASIESVKDLGNNLSKAATSVKKAVIDRLVKIKGS